MTKEQCSLQPNYYGSSCDFQDLQSAVQQLTTKSDAQFEELKNEKWFHRIFNMVVCPRKNNIRMAEQITSLAQAQGILIEILVRLADQDANIAGMVMQSQSDIRALAQNSAYLQERLYLLEDKSYGIKENENLKDLNSQQRNILSGCLNEASKLYAMPSNEQRLYANELLNYLNADAQVANLEDALDDLEDNTKRKILSCIITYMYLYDHTTESMEQDEQEDFIDLFDLGRKTIKSLKQQTVDTYRLRGVDGCIDRYITAPIEITEETPFEVELPEPKAAEGASEAQTEENGEEAIDTNAPREKLVLSGSIQNDGETVYKNKDIHFSSAIMNCKGTVKFINCTIHYNEDKSSHIFLGDGATLLIASTTVVCHGICQTASDSNGFFVKQTDENKDSASCVVKDSTFIDCVAFINGKFVSGEFKNNRTYGACASFLSLVIRKGLTFSNNRFVFPDKPTYEFICKDWAGYNAFIRLDGNNITVENSVFECENNLAGSSYMIKTGTYAINGPGHCLSDTSRERGTISNCTFVRVSNCIREMGVVENCIFENCSNVVNNCGYIVRENLFNGCKQACVDLQKKAIVSNCQFANCTGFNLITSTTNSEVKIEDCEFSNISTGKINSIEDLNNFGAQEYFNGNAPHDLQMLGIKGSVIEFGAADKKFANANHPNKIVRCIFNNIHICPTQSYYYNHGSWKVLGTENQSNFMISVKIFDYEKFDYPRAIVSECSFTNCFAVPDSLINEYFDFKPVFSKNRYYRLIRQENNYGLDNTKNPSDFVESNNVKVKETDASGKKIGSSMPTEWDDSEYTTCKMATTWLNTFNKA